MPPLDSTLIAFPLPMAPPDPPPHCPPLPECLPEVTHGPAVVCACRCGTCCKTMAIRATASDTAREPRLALVGNPIAYDAAGNPVAWLLNTLDHSERDGIGACPFFLPATNGDRGGVCTIHDTRPDVCRRLDCDTLGEIARKHLAEWKAALAAAESRSGQPPESPAP